MAEEYCWSVTQRRNDHAVASQVPLCLEFQFILDSLVYTVVVNRIYVIGQ